MSIQPSLPDFGMSIDAVIGERVRTWLFRRHVLQTSLARALGITQPALSRKMGGYTGWNATDLIKAAAFLEVPITELLPEELVEAELKTKTPRLEQITDEEPQRARRDSNPQPSDP